MTAHIGMFKRQDQLLWFLDEIWNNSLVIPPGWVGCPSKSGSATTVAT